MKRFIPKLSDQLFNGGSCIAGPNGEWILEPQVNEEKIFYEELDFKKVLEERQNFDVAGHYSRPDVTRLIFNPNRNSILEIKTFRRINKMVVLSYILILNSFAAVLVGIAGLNRKMGFWGAFAWGFFLGFLAFFIVLGAKRKNPIGCRHCGNADNEALYCGLCHKNDAGDLRPGYIPEDRTGDHLLH